MNSTRQNKQLAETLSRVLSEWNSGKEKIRYTIDIPKSKWDFIFDMVTCIIWGSFGLGAFVLALRQHLLFPVGIVTFLCGIVVYVLARKNAPYTYIINRKKKRLYCGTYGMQSYIQQDYGEPFSLPTFRLPDNDYSGKYARMREKLQKKITDETGWTFEN